MRSRTSIALLAGWVCAAGSAAGCSSESNAAIPQEDTPAAVASAQDNGEPSQPEASAAVAPSPTAADGHIACADAPPNMVCIPGGPAVLGAEGDSQNPKRTAEVSTFYLDKHEVTNREYNQCVKAGFCEARSGLNASIRPFVGPEKPAVPMQWPMANAYCVWVGKRLPTEAEWEKAARGGEKGLTYPWGEDEPSCERTSQQSCENGTKDVGSYPAGAYGLHDMAGNGAEWVHDWASDCIDGCEKACGDACSGTDPAGPCGGAPRCRGFYRRVMKGGIEDGNAAPSHARRAERPLKPLRRGSFRCASSTSMLATWPPAHIEKPRPALPDPEPPTEEELAIFRSVEDDEDIMKIKTCYRSGVANVDCRDPMTYIRSNESAQRLWAPYIANLGGGYVGLGSDQGYSFIAHARSRWAWLFDYDPSVVRLHYMLEALIKRHETPKEFVAAFRKKNAVGTWKYLKETLQDHPEVDEIASLYRQSRGKLAYYYNRNSVPYPNRKVQFGWLRTTESYQYIRLMYQQGRIKPHKGNMLNAKVLPAIGESAKKLGVPMRVYYPSNAEEQWTLPEQYQDNVLAFPFDEQGVILRTYHTKRWHSEEESKWHYVVHSGMHAQQLLRVNRYNSSRYFMEYRLPTKVNFFSVIGLPGTIETQTAGVTPVDNQVSR